MYQPRGHLFYIDFNRLKTLKNSSLKLEGPSLQYLVCNYLIYSNCCPEVKKGPALFYNDSYLGKALKIFLSGTRRPRPLIFGM